MRVLVHTPAPPLARFVERIWYFESALSHHRERILPSGTMQVLINLHEDELRAYHGGPDDPPLVSRGAAVSGPYARPFAIDTAEQRRIAGITFRPGGAAPFLPLPCLEVREQHVALGDVWGTDGAVLRERLLEADSGPAVLATLETVLREWWARGSMPGEGILASIDALDRGQPVADVLDAIGMGHGRFVRGFRAAVGLTPKRFARIRRFRRVLAAVSTGQPAPWAEMAVACGYYDQAHLIRDFRELGGMRPSAYAPRGPGDDTHVVVPA